MTTTKFNNDNDGKSQNNDSDKNFMFHENREQITSGKKPLSYSKESYLSVFENDNENRKIMGNENESENENNNENKNVN